MAALHKCNKCAEYTLKAVCPYCGASAVSPEPAKYSPEDHYGEYRRKLKKLDGATLPRAARKP